MKSKAKDNALNKLASIERERVYRDWWRFQYTNRYFKKRLQTDPVMGENADKAFRWLTVTFNKFKLLRTYPAQNKAIDYPTALFEFTNCLVYSYHKRTQADGFLDIRYELLLCEYGHPLDTVPSEDFDFVEYLHRLTVGLGFLSILLDLQPDYTVSWEIFIDGKDEFDPTNSLVQTYSYPKTGDNPKGIQVSTSDNPREVNNEWDRVIYCSLDDTDTYLKEQLAELWKDGGKHKAGDSENYDIALFIQSEKCTPNSVFEFLKLQVKWTLISHMNRLIRVVGEKSKTQVTDVRPHKKLKNLESDLLAAIKLSEGLVEKRKDIEKDNVRRAVGLYLWDEFYWSNKKLKSKESLIIEVVRQLEKNNLACLEHYRQGYRRDMNDLDKGSRAFKTVVREMLVDLEVADYCIKHFELFNYNQVISARVSE